MDFNSRIINLLPYKSISITEKFVHHTLIQEVTIIIEDSDDYYFIQDDVEKVKDVSQMPKYIKEDWIKYNRKPLTKEVLELHIQHYKDLSDQQYPPDEETDEILSLLKSIKRHQIIGKIV